MGTEENPSPQAEDTLSPTGTDDALTPNGVRVIRAQSSVVSGMPIYREITKQGSAVSGKETRSRTGTSFAEPMTPISSGVSDGQPGESLDLARSFEKQVVLVKRLRGGLPEWIGCPHADTFLKVGDSLYYGVRSVHPADELALSEAAATDDRRRAFFTSKVAAEVCAERVATSGGLEGLFCESADDVEPAVADCFTITAPAAWDNCVLGGEEQAVEGQGFLSFRQNWRQLTIAAILPGGGSLAAGAGAGAGARPLVLFPGGADVIRAGDTLLVPRKYKDLRDGPAPFTLPEREAMTKVLRVQRRAVRTKSFFEPAYMDKLCQQGKARRAQVRKKSVPEQAPPERRMSEDHKERFREALAKFDSVGTPTSPKVGTPTSQGKVSRSGSHSEK